MPDSLLDKDQIGIAKFGRSPVKTGYDASILRSSFRSRNFGFFDPDS